MELDVIDYKSGYYKSDYTKAIEKLMSKRCTNCSGYGIINNAELGDMYYTTWICTECEGKGMIEND